MRGNTVVNGDDQPNAVPMHRVDRIAVQSVPLAEPARQQIGDVCGKGFQRVRQDRGRAYAVCIVIAVNADAFFCFDRLSNASNGAVHVGKRKRIGQFSHFGMQKRFDRRIRNQTAPRKHGGKRSCEPEPCPDVLNYGVGIVRIFSHHIAHRHKNGCGINSAALIAFSESDRGGISCDRELFVGRQDHDGDFGAGL